jgi:transcriptional regulator with XRE-family HTH domain
MVCGMPDTLSGRVAANLRAELARRGLTQETFADQAGVHRTTMTRMLNGSTSMDLERLEQLARILEVEPSKLLND